MYFFVLLVCLGELVCLYLFVKESFIFMFGFFGIVVIECIVDGLIVVFVLFIVFFWLFGEGGVGYVEICVVFYFVFVVFGGVLVLFFGVWVCWDIIFRLI